MDDTADGRPILAKKTPPPAVLSNIFGYAELQQWKHMLVRSLSSLCAICLTEFVHGEQVCVLPRYNHDFHPRCIDQWLRLHPTCPTYRQSSFPVEPIAPDL
ncbi:hypothetical protein GUJ93_ZPchr0005g14532 [Zizania palustris]|uniref:RING-type domain-containing protein n=1 Tax=Zizania palustris TaxID=103762 RepID=A0A8J5S4T2_ZIZPA|nr:hypothetical protein GUJ93_ZPchr0005g14532 [Zizania palustris]